jgi:hypothetical protein
VTTVWQRAALQVNDYQSAPSEWFDKLFLTGYTSIHINLRQENELPSYYVERLRGKGFKMLGFFMPQDYRTGIAWSPTETMEFCLSSKARYPGLSGFILNCEDSWEREDQVGNGYPSRDFLYQFRKRWPKLSLALDTYSGCGGIALESWEAAAARLYVQSYREGLPYAERAMDGQDWAVRYGWKNRAKVKPGLGIFKGMSGERPTAELLISTCLRAKSYGLKLWYTEGCWDDPDLMMKISNAFGTGGIAAR